MRAYHCTDAAASVAQAQTKICSLCCALNHAENTDCFVCGWTGAFETNPEMVAQAWTEVQSVFGGVTVRQVTKACFESRSAVSFPHAAKSEERSAGKSGTSEPVAQKTRRPVWQRLKAWLHKGSRPSG